MSTIDYRFQDISIVPWMILGIVLLQNAPWFIWGSAYYIMSALVIMLFVVLAQRFVLQSHKYGKHILIIMFSFLFFVLFNSFYSFRFSSLITWLVFILMFLITDKEKIKAMDLLTTYLSIVVGISLIGWLTNTYLINLPELGTLQMEKMGGATIVLRNYGIFLQYDNDYVNRFYSVFDEPGVLGTLSAFILFINKYNLKDKRNLIIFLGGIFTFSFAYVILILIGTLIVFSKNLFSILKFLVIGGALVFAVYFFLSNNATFQQSIIERGMDLSSNTERRTSDLMNQFFDRFIQSKDVILGMGTSFIPDNKYIFQGQGYQFFIIEYGIVGVIILFLMYLSLLERMNKLSIGLLFLFLLSFIQRPFLFTAWQITLFSIGLASLKNISYPQKKFGS